MNADFGGGGPGAEGSCVPKGSLMPSLKTKEEERPEPVF